MRTLDQAASTCKSNLSKQGPMHAHTWSEHAHTTLHGLNQSHAHVGKVPSYYKGIVPLLTCVQEEDTSGGPNMAGPAVPSCGKTSACV